MVSNPSENILNTLEMLSEDKRLARVLGSDSSSPCALQLWLLELEQDKSPPEYRLLFGWVIPATLQSTDKWNTSDGGKKKNWGIQNNSYKFRIAKLTLYLNSNAIFNLINGLCQGKSLDCSCDEAGIVRPADLENPYGQLRLTGSPGQLAKSFAVRPVGFLETSEINSSIIKELQSIVSPIDNVPAFAASLWRLDKLNLFSRNGEEPLPEADGLAKKCLSHLTEETGLNFCGVDSKRLGNIEWLYFPAADENENSQVKISIDSSTYGVKVEILPDALKSATQVLVRCRLLNDREVILDQCKTSQITETSTRVNFKANQAIGNVLVTIWIRQNHEDTWDIWYEDSLVQLQQINLNLGVVGFQGSLQSDWLQEYMNSRVRNRVEKAQAFRQVHYEHLKVGGFQSSPWIAANQQIYKLTQRLFPEPSGGRFFPNGWDADEPGRLKFSEWLKSLTNNSTASKILIIDPYFDAVGITELIARAEAVQTEYVVLTNTQITSDDNLRELEKACTDLEFLLTNLKFRLLDLRSKQGGKTQLFHDRYILVFDEFVEVKTGYHLSNSIQGATKKHPLLVTPIPEDVLTAVENYVDDLLVPGDNSPDELITLFSSVNGTETPSSNEYQYGLAAIPYAGSFFATLLNESTLSHMSEPELVNYLQRNGILIEEDSSFAINGQIESQLDYFVRVLVASSAENFAKLWAAFASWLAQLPDSSEYFSKIIASGGEKLALKIQRFLSNAPEQQLPLGSLGARMNTDSARITQLISHNFKEALRNAKFLLESADNRSWSNFSRLWGIRYGADALAQNYPEQLVSIVSTLTAELQTAEDTHKYWAIADTLTLIVKQILNQLIQIQHFSVADNKLFPAFLASDVPLLRAIAAQNLSPSWNRSLEFHQICLSICYLRYVVLFSQTDCGKTATDLFASLTTTVTLADLLLQDTFTAINKLQEVERIYTLSEWVFELRIRANVNNNKDADYKRLRLQIFERINCIWSVNFTPKDLRDIVRRLSGPGEGSWSTSTTKELLLLLKQNNKLTFDQITQLWLTILFERLESHVSATAHKKEDLPSFLVCRDTELTNVCGWVLANATVECRESWLEKFDKKIQKPGVRILYRPFSRSRDFSTWINARDGLLWLQILVNLILLHGVNKVEKKELEEVASKLDSVLVNSLKQDLLKSTNALLEFASRVKEDLEKHQNLLANRNNI